ncbi:MAG TPA: efflux RND transporter periplasmic adaptor subunit [Kofleriaceae bacterium]|nr:efflux RND transporter periplasmic adaptor subunit [Kofleriaceae bacterium]
MRLFTIIVIVIALAACKKGAQEQPKSTNEVPTIKLAPEDIVVLARGELQTGPRISGTLQAASRAVVRAETQGSVVAIGPELGQPVKKGDLLARIEAKALGDVASSAKSGLESAQAQYDLALREVQRTEALVKGGALAARELDRAKSELSAATAAVTQARAQVASSQSQLGDATVKAPLAGVVARRAISVGDVVSPGSELYEVIDPSTMRLDASVASEDLSVIALGKAVDFEVRGYPGQLFTGKIQRIAPAADPVTRQIQVLVDIPNPGGKLIAGLYAEGRIAVERREALTAPVGAIDSAGDQPTVLRVKNSVVERVIVALGVRDERAEVVEVTSGLAPGDVLVLARAQKNVGPGAKVELPQQGAKTEDKPAAPDEKSAAPDEKPQAPAAKPTTPDEKPADKKAPAAGSAGK